MKIPELIEREAAFSPVQICKWFAIPRTTLFRWEQTGELPRAERGPKDERIYRQMHLKRIADIMRGKAKEEFGSCLRNSPQSECPPLLSLERLYRSEFFGTTNPHHGLQQLGGLALRHALSGDTVQVLADFALDRPPGDELRTKIWRVLALNDTTA